MNKQLLENDLKRCLQLISASWKIQNNKADMNTNFIYKTYTLDECLQKIKEYGVDKNYALHRWYNYMTSIVAEDLFCEFGAKHERDIYNHDVDVYINDVPFDIKLTIYPAKLSNKPYDLNTREGKDKMIKWYYEHQSQQNRKQLINRLYIVCDGDNSQESLAMKSNFALLRKEIGIFMKSLKNKGFNKIIITEEGKDYELFSDIIYICYK